MPGMIGGLGWELDARATDENARALGLGLAKLFFNDLDLCRVDHRADIDLIIAGDTLAKLGGQRDHLGDELIIDRLVDIDALHRHADLARIKESAPYHAARGALQVRSEERRVGK